jgi:hypothetical protein
MERAAVVSTAAALLALGYTAGIRGVLLAAGATALVVIAWFPPWDDGDLSSAASSCDPSCGLSSTGFLILVLPIVIVTAAAGAILRRIARSALRRPTA